MASGDEDGRHEEVRSNSQYGRLSAVAANPAYKGFSNAGRAQTVVHLKEIRLLTEANLAAESNNPYGINVPKIRGVISAHFNHQDDNIYIFMSLLQVGGKKAKEIETLVEGKTMAHHIEALKILLPKPRAERDIGSEPADAIPFNHAIVSFGPELMTGFLAGLMPGIAISDDLLVAFEIPPSMVPLVMCQAKVQSEFAQRANISRMLTQLAYKNENALAHIVFLNSKKGLVSSNIDLASTESALMTATGFGRVANVLVRSGWRFPLDSDYTVKYMEGAGLTDFVAWNPSGWIYESSSSMAFQVSTQKAESVKAVQRAADVFDIARTEYRDPEYLRERGAKV